MDLLSRSSRVPGSGTIGTALPGRGSSSFSFLSPPEEETVVLLPGDEVPVAADAPVDGADVVVENVFEIIIPITVRVRMMIRRDSFIVLIS